MTFGNLTTYTNYNAPIYLLISLIKLPTEDAQTF